MRLFCSSKTVTGAPCVLLYALLKRFMFMNLCLVEKKRERETERQTTHQKLGI